ncbi:PREDICTED: proteasome inhibitor PI31 subunit [Diuraphis noxia]|uniref:proteasome inhibitor PI31 subunit n=1 Tax=Diuraphis noxia TaxID=143948 RepID=UPI0007637028|nr:PREDICTED: proteasome inhibitor PI31 subunit [Diuraphis noxia]
MAENSSKFWFLTFEYFKKDVNKPEDNLVILVHWLLLRNNFQVLKLDNEDKVNEEQPTDILPANWSQNEMYKLHYKRDNELYLLSGVKACDSFIFNFYNVITKHVASAAIGNINSAVKWISDSAKNKDKFYETICLLENDLINPMQKENTDKKTVSTQTKKSVEDDPLIMSRGQLPGHPPGYQPEPYRPINPFPSYGMPDLNPLGGGGMLFDPLMQRRGPNNRPGVPPMARFDPIHPNDPDPMMPGSFRGPRPDHMRPPDFDDSLYM